MSAIEFSVRGDREQMAPVVRFRVSTEEPRVLRVSAGGQIAQLDRRSLQDLISHLTIAINQLPEDGS